MKKLSTGCAASYANVSTATLKYYDRIGLLKPKTVDPSSKYRQYTIEELSDLFIIRQMRELDIPLEEIRKYMNGEKLDTLIDILSEKYNENAARLKEMEMTQKLLSNKLAILRDYNLLKPTFGEISERYIRTRKVLTFGTEDREEEEIIYSFNRLGSHISIKGGGWIGCTYGWFTNRQYLESGEKPDYFQIFAISDYPDQIYQDEYTDILPEGKYICMNYGGGTRKYFENIQPAVAYIREKGYKIKGKAANLCRITDIFTNDPNEWVYEVQIPVETEQEAQ